MIARRISIALALCALMGTAAFAKEKHQVVTFGQDFIVGEKVVQKGTYKVVFDDASNELSIVDRKTKEVLAKTSAHLEKRAAGAAGGISIRWAAKGETQSLVSVAFPGERQDVVVSGGTADASGSR